MRVAMLLPLAAWLALSGESGRATSYVTKEGLAAHAECLARWKDVDGVWEGQLSTPGVDVGGPYDKRIYVRLVFSRSGTTLLVKDRPDQAWKRLGDDPSPPNDKSRLLVIVRTNDSKDPRNHAISFSRLRESSAKLVYSRVKADPRPGEAVSTEDLRSGVVVREGSPVPTGLAAELWECVPK